MSLTKSGLREILFRGKRVDNGEWVEGYLVYNHSRKKYYILTDAAAFPIEVIPETVGQYIGYTDINETKIFEDDILKGFRYPFKSEDEYNYYAIIEWFKNSSAFGIYTHKNPKANVMGISEGNTDYLGDFDKEIWEVIGNIHDNPELLEVQK